MLYRGWSLYIRLFLRGFHASSRPSTPRIKKYIVVGYLFPNRFILFIFTSLFPSSSLFLSTGHVNCRFFFTLNAVEYKVESAQKLATKVEGGDVHFAHDENPQHQDLVFFPLDLVEE